MHILTISGSLRDESFNSLLLKAFEAHAGGHTVTHATLAGIPLYDQDLESEFPESVTALKAQIRAADGIIIATPEYNRSIPGILKNMIDWTSRPYGDNAWAKKPVYVVGASTGSIGTAVAQTDLRKIMLYLDAHVLGQPEFYMGNAREKFSAEGELTDESTIEHITKALAVFTTFAERFKN